ncbi:MAG: CoA-binding protein [Proteobacteria bacterium]|nr:CoA-binding protein [Pseudomonadota bacterium]
METQDEKKKAILEQSKTIAVAGLSPKEDRPSNMVAQYLIAAGYTVIPVNPQYNEILGRRCYKSLSDIPKPVDIVDIFMKSEHALPIVEEAIKIKPKCIWLQLGIINEEAERLVVMHGIPFFMNVCIKQEHTRLSVKSKQQTG